MAAMPYVAQIRTAPDPDSLATVSDAEVTVYDAVGGMPFFERLVGRFYDGVEGDDVLAPLYPEGPDFSGARRRLTLFLAQYWGGPGTYSEERGHPRLRMRHFPFPVGPRQRDRWLFHMTTAVEAGTRPGQVRDALLRYFVMAAEQMVNTPGEEATG
jgi:hemoglobin